MNLTIKIGGKRNTTELDWFILIMDRDNSCPYFKHVINIFWALDNFFSQKGKNGPQIQGQTRTNMIVTFQDGRRTLGRDWKCDRDEGDINA